MGVTDQFQTTETIRVWPVTFVSHGSLMDDRPSEAGRMQGGICECGLGDSLISNHQLTNVKRDAGPLGPNGFRDAADLEVLRKDAWALTLLPGLPRGDADMINL